MPITVRIGHKTVNFTSTDQCEFSLAGRVGLPASRVVHQLTTSSKTLLKDAEVMKKLDFTTISMDNDWRTIFDAMDGVNTHLNGYRKSILTKYLQYIAARQTLIKFINSCRNEPQITPGPDTNNPRDTALFDLTIISNEGHRNSRFMLLPKGKTIEISLAPKQSITVLLAKHRFSIVREDQFRFVDESGREIALCHGKNIMGRANENEVVVDSNYRKVSRKHLIVETQDLEAIHLTDVSSLGTFIPVDFLVTTPRSSNLDSQCLSYPTHPSPSLIESNCQFE